MKRQSRNETLGTHWQQLAQRVCLNPAASGADEEQDKGRGSAINSDYCPTIGNTRTVQKLILAQSSANKTLATRTRSAVARGMMTTIKQDQQAVIECGEQNNGDVRDNEVARQQQQQQSSQPVLPHDEGTSPKSEGVFAPENLPQQQREQQQRQPVVIGATRPTRQDKLNNGRSGNEAAQEGASGGCGKQQQQQQQHNAPTATNKWQRAQPRSSKKHQQQQQQFVGHEKHPLDAASLISKLFFGWMLPIVFHGWRFGLKLADMPKQSSAADSCHKIGDKLVANWNKELASCNQHHLRPGHVSGPSSRAGRLYEGVGQVEGSGGGGGCDDANGRRPSLMRAVLRTHFKWILFNSSITLFSEVMCKSLSAYSVGQMLELMSRRESADYSRVWSLEEPLVCWTLTLVVSLGLWVLSAHFYGFQMMRVGLHVRVGCSYLIYRKSLKLGQFESSEKTMGKMINLMTNDLDKFNYVFIFLPFIWVGPIQCLVSLYLLWPRLGPASLGSLLVIAILLPIHIYLGSKFAKYRRRIASITDERVRLLNETISALKLIKLYAWEYPMRGAMHEVRRRETDLINRVSIIKATSSALMYVSSKLVLFGTILLHCSVFGATLDARTLFMSMALLNNIQFIMCQLMPRSVGLAVESLVSLSRIGDFLLSNEFEPSSRLYLGGNDDQTTTTTTDERNHLPIQHLSVQKMFDHNKRVSIEFERVCARWPEAANNTLDQITFSCRSPALIGVCGQLASGKSSLLMTLLNELPIHEGRAHLVGVSGYCSQKAWIFNGTVRDNIVFGEEFNELRYRRVLEVCALERDLDLLDCADFTYIQANSLSGGQQARVNLARCLYRRSDIYLLDDPFSALDGSVAEHIFEQAIKRFLANKLVLMATHHVGMLKQSDKVLLLDDGKQLAFCGFNELYRKLTSAETGGGGGGCCSGKWFTSEQLQRLSFLVEGINVEQSEAAAAAADDKKQSQVSGSGGGNSIHGGGDKMMDNYCCEVAHDGYIDKSGSDSEKERDERELFNTSSVAAPTSSAPVVVPDGKSLRPILASNAAKADDNQGNSSSASEVADGAGEPTSAVCHEASPRLVEPVATVATATARAVNSPTVPQVAYGCPSGGNDLISVKNEREAFGALNVGAANGVEGNFSGAESRSERRGPAEELAGNGESDKVESEHGRDGQHSGMEAAHYRTEVNNGEQSGGVSPESSDISATKALVEQESKQQEFMKEQQQRTTIGVDRKISCNYDEKKKKKKEVEEGSGGGGSRSGPADEETPGHSNKLPGLYVWYKYYTQTSVIRLLLIILTFLITQALFSAVDIYLTVWSLVEQNKALVNEITVFNQQHLNTVRQQQQQLQLQLGRGKFNYGDGSAERLRAINRSIKMGEHDLWTDGRLVPLLARPSEELDIAGALGAIDHNDDDRASISPLSLRSSDDSLLANSNRRFVLSPLRVVDLFYVSSDVVGSTKTKETASVSATIYTENFAQTNDSPGTNSQVNLYLAHDPASYDSNNFTSSTYEDNHNNNNFISSRNNYGNHKPASATTTTFMTLVDENIRGQSDEALNVKSIYRPLYLLVANFTNQYQYQLTYTILLLVLFSSSTFTNILTFTSSTKSAIILYGKLIDNALFAKLTFFDTNPTGRLLNRATRDIGIIDETIPMQAQQAYELLLKTAATFILVAATDSNLALPSLVILSILFIYHSISVKPTKDIQRLEGILRSPILSHISTSLDGLHTIRASKCERRFERLFLKYQDENSSVFLLQIGCNRSTAIVLDCLSASYTSLIALWAVVSGLTGPAAGLIVTSAMLLSGLTSHGILKLTETESLMTSVERVIEYCSLPQEENYDGKRRREDGGFRRNGDGGGGGEREHWLSATSKSNYNIAVKQQQIITSPATSVAGWPNNGSVEYKHVDFYYSNKLEKPVLKNISFRLQSGEKVAIVGRTGAGKSSIIATLFRLYDFNGTILIDGVDITNIDLIELRSAIGIIPQSPVLFSTTIRKNLDPCNVYDDFALWSALDKAHLRETVAALPGKLDYDIGSGGLSFSSGQKQLICLARVLLRQSRLIVLDEATANVDPTTDSIIQATIRREFNNCTIITIAHRLETILDYDRIMVLEAGRIVDFDTPAKLASKKDGFFASHHLINKAPAVDEHTN